MTAGEAKGRLVDPHQGRDDRGFALIMVITVMTILLMGSLVAVQYVLGYLPTAAADQSREAALAAAQAGVSDYLNRLNQDPTYWNDGGTNLAMQTSPSWGWVQVAPGSHAYYHYSINDSDLTSYKETNSPTGSEGTLYITSTGKVGDVARTIEVGVRQADFLNNLYMSQYNLVDPTMAVPAAAAAHALNSNNPVLTPAQAAACVTYLYTQNGSGNGPQMTQCSDMINFWITGQILDGPMQSDDEYYLNGTPTFEDSVSTADPNTGSPTNATNDSPYWADWNSSSSKWSHTMTGDNPSFAGGAITGGAPDVVFPSSLYSYISQDVAAPGAPNANLGCEYYGPTAIRFSGASMYVFSPDTPPADVAAGCLAAGSSSTALTSTALTTALPLPPNGVIYVANTPAASATYPCTTDAPSWAQFASTTGCAGNAFVEGTADGQVTVAADQNIYLEAPSGAASPVTIGSQSTGGGDVMGLEANNFILINHDTSSGGSTDTFGPEVYEKIIQAITINAAIFTLAGSLATENFWVSPVMGNLIINGAIVSEFMDIEGSFDSTTGKPISGYNEEYFWDQRLAHLTPPYFIPPSADQWSDTTYAELAAQCAFQNTCWK